jgi:hypothetical protein
LSDGDRFANREKGGTGLKDLPRFNIIYVAGECRLTMVDCLAFDVMLGVEHSPLKDKFPEIYNICREQDITVAAAAAMDWGFTFRRWMPHDHESIMHMFFECDAAKYFWSSVG